MIYSRSIDTCISHVSKVCVTPLQLMKDLRSYLFSLTKRNSEGFCFCEGLCGSYPCEVFVSLVTGGPPSLFPLCHTPVPEASKKWYSVFLTDHTLDVWILYPGFLFINIFLAWSFKTRLLRIIPIGPCWVPCPCWTNHCGGRDQRRWLMAWNQSTRERGWTQFLKTMGISKHQSSLLGSAKWKMDLRRQDMAPFSSCHIFSSH